MSLEKWIGPRLIKTLRESIKKNFIKKRCNSIMTVVSKNNIIMQTKLVNKKKSSCQNSLK